MIEPLKAASLSFKGAEALSVRDAYQQKLDNNSRIQVEQAAKFASVDKPQPPEGVGKKLDVVA